MERKTLKEIVYHEILKAIVNGQYAAGQVLNEQTLIDRFGYSKSPIREALVMLCNEGVLRNIPRYGYEIVQFTADDITEIMTYRRILECGLLQNCFHNISPNQLDQLKAAQSSSYPMPEDALSRWNNNQNFHMVLAGFANNGYAYKQLLSTMKMLRIAYSQKNWSRLWEAYNSGDPDPHDEIIEGIETKNLTKAETALRNDLSSFVSIYQT